VVACFALALAYLPPRGARPSDRSSLFTAQTRQATPARQRAQAVSDEWRAADGSLRLLRARRQVHELLREARAGTPGTSLIVVSESADVATATAPLADSAIHVAWRQLGLGETKFRVAVIIQLSSAAQGHDRPLPEEGRAVYLGPDSTDRTTCIAVVSLGSYWTRIVAGDLRAAEVLEAAGRVPFEALVQFFKAGLGPCAFYAAYGTPGKSVRGWLVARGWDLALTLDAGARGRGSSVMGITDPRYSWSWDAIYALPPTAVACLASRPEGCRAAVLAGASDDPVIPVPDIVDMDRRWWRHVPRLVGGQRFLGDVAHEVGRDRFLSFWTSALPVDTALAAALKRPVGEWTAEWQRDFVGPIRLGPAPPLGGVAIALAIAVLAVVVVAVTASRRQVR
jgi:hypothetical protein